MTTSNGARDEQHVDPTDGARHENDDVPTEMLASPTRTRL